MIFKPFNNHFGREPNGRESDDRGTASANQQVTRFNQTGQRSDANKTNHFWNIYRIGKSQLRLTQVLFEKIKCLLENKPKC